MMIVCINEDILVSQIQFTVYFYGLSVFPRNYRSQLESLSYTIRFSHRHRADQKLELSAFLRRSLFFADKSVRIYEDYPNLGLTCTYMYMY